MLYFVIWEGVRLTEDTSSNPTKSCTKEDEPLSPEAIVGVEAGSIGRIAKSAEDEDVLDAEPFDEDRGEEAGDDHEADW